MGEFHYNYIKPKYQENVDLLFIDTDSLCYKIRTKNIYKGIDFEYYDTSNFPREHRQYSETNKKVVGKFKDEAYG